MASYVPVPRDYTKVKDKLILNLTKRQLVCFSGAALIGVPSFFVFKQMLHDISLATILMMGLMMPLFFLAMYEKNGEPCEVIIKHMLEWKFIRPKIRPYESRNYYAALLKQQELEREVNAIATEHYGKK